MKCSLHECSVQFSSVQLLSRVWLLETPWIAARQASLSITISQSALKLTSIESVMPSNHLILCCPLLLLSSIFPSIRVFSKTFSTGERKRYGPALLRASQPRESLHLGKPHCSGKRTPKPQRWLQEERAKKVCSSFQLYGFFETFFPLFSSEVTQQI